MIRYVILALTGLATALTVATLFSSVAGAADARQFNAGRIIDDSVFTNSSAMSVADIQRFLDSKVSCDTWGQKRSELGGGTRAQWMNARGHSAPFRCVTDYRENPANGQSNYGRSDAPAGSISAAQIIYNYSVQFNINPQVLIVTLQKENGMITDEWPTPKQYREAMGFGCPDNVAPGAPACNPSYGSFSTQIYQAARHFRGYIDNPAGWWVPFTTGVNSIAWSPTASCGRGNVTIENRATVALYSYTPYQPNQAAKNAQYGTGDGCSAYGNRNFYLYFTDWFGSTSGSLSVSDVRVSTDSIGQIFTGGPVTVSFTARNLTKSSFAFSSIGIAVRGPSGQNLDPGWDNAITIAPGATYTYSKTFLPSVEGRYTVYLSSYAASDSNWRECELNNTQSTCRNARTIQHPLIITRGIDFKDKATGQAIDSFKRGRSFLGSYQFQNTSSMYPARVGKVMIAGRNDAGESRDFGLVNVGSLNPGQSFTYEQEGIVTDPTGGVKFYTSLTKDDGVNWEEAFFTNTGNTQQVRSMDVNPGATLFEGPVASLNPVVNSPVAITVKVKNYADNPVDLGKIGVVVRGPQGQNADPGWERVENLSSTANDGVHTYRANFTPSAPGNWTVDYTQVSADMRVWNANYPASDSASVKRSATVLVLPQATVVSSVLADGDTVGNRRITFSVKNHGTQSINLGKVGLVARDPSNNNADPLWQDFVVAAGATKEYSVSMNIIKRGVWTFTIGSYENNVWKNLTSDSASVSQSLKLNIK